MFLSKRNLLFSNTCMLSCFSCVQLFATPWTVTFLALSMGFPRQEYWSGLPFPPPGDLPHPGIEPTSSVSPVLAGGFSTTEPLGKPTTHGPCSKRVAISCLPIRVKGSVSLVLVVLHATVFLLLRGGSPLSAP